MKQLSIFNSVPCSSPIFRNQAFGSGSGRKPLVLQVLSLEFFSHQVFDTPYKGRPTEIKSMFKLAGLLVQSYHFIPPCQKNITKDLNGTSSEVTTP